jgi:hypothetical protein
MSECYICAKQLQSGYLCETHAKELYKLLVSGDCCINEPDFCHHCHICGEHEDRKIVLFNDYLFCCDRDIVEEYSRYYRFVDNEELYFIEPWHSIEEGSKQLEQEVYNEFGENHLLHGSKLKAIARRYDQDDVLFQILDDTKRYAVIHLTWSGSQEMDGKWPSTKIFSDIHEWVISGMINDSKLF